MPAAARRTAFVLALVCSFVGRSIRGTGRRRPRPPHPDHHAPQRAHRAAAAGCQHAGRLVPDVGARGIEGRDQLHRPRASLRAHDVPRHRSPAPRIARAHDRGPRRTRERLHHRRHDRLLRGRRARFAAAGDRTRGRAPREPEDHRGDARERAPGGPRRAADAHRGLSPTGAPSRCCSRPPSWRFRIAYRRSAGAATSRR